MKGLLRKITSNFSELFKEIEVPKNHKACPSCDGMGSDDGFTACEECDGKGLIRKTYQEYVDSLPSK